MRASMVAIVALAALLWLSGCASTEQATESVEAVQAPAEAAPDSASKSAPPGPPKAKPAGKPMAKPKESRAYAPLMRKSAPGAYRTLPLHTYSGKDRFPDKTPSGVVMVADQPVSTFSVDVDTTSYAFARRYLSNGRMPPRSSVRVEEMLNYFPYAYPAPPDRRRPFTITTTVLPSPWSAENQLMHIAVRGYDIPRSQRPRINLVLLIDVSGSMSPPHRLPLLKEGFRLFADQLRDDDRVSIVTYANQVQVRLEPTRGADKQKIVQVIDRLVASGGTAGGAGLQRAYEMAERHFDRNAVNRVILATDGDFNIGITNPEKLEEFVANKRKTGIYFSVFGVGTGNLNDALMQRLAHAGNGNAAYIDSLQEARKAMSEDVASTLFPIADDVKLQVEFDPARVRAYRLIGYETRALRKEDFGDDKVDAGDVGAGHTVTAIYELYPAGRDQRARPTPSASRAGTLAHVRMRYKVPGASKSKLIQRTVQARSAHASIRQVPVDQRFAVAVAAFAQRLRGEAALSGYGYGEMAALAYASRGEDKEGYRVEFTRLVLTADVLQGDGHR